MKGKNPTFTLFGSNSGNNVGDAAILSAILDSIASRLASTTFLVPTTKPEFVNMNYGARFRVRALNIMPWNLSFRFFGLPSLYCLWKSDVALICDGIIFGKKLFNPTFNLLITLAPLAFFAKLFRCKLVCFSCGIGPFPSGRGGALARYLLNSCHLIMMRDSESKRIAESIGVTAPIEITGDAAFLNPVSSVERARDILEKKGVVRTHRLIGINVTAYVNRWLAGQSESMDASAFVKLLGRGLLDAFSEMTENVTPVVFSTHPMDESVARELSQLIGGSVISNTEFLSHDMQAVMRECSLFIGMRFHSLILSSAVGVPVVGIVYAPKVAALMQELRSSHYALTIDALSSDSLRSAVTTAWEGRHGLATVQQIEVDRLKRGAMNAADKTALLAAPALARIEKSAGASDRCG